MNRTRVEFDEECTKHHDVQDREPHDDLLLAKFWLDTVKIFSSTVKIFFLIESKIEKSKKKFELNHSCDNFHRIN